MTTTPFMALMLFSSSILCFFMNSWLTIWVVLEINTLTFCCMMKSFTSEKKMSTESSMKYFIIQSATSSLLIFSMSVTGTVKKLFMLLFITSVLSLLVKMASSPFHQWFINLTKKMGWKNSSLLLTWQKLAPVFLLVYQMKSMLLPFLILSAFVGSLSQMNKTNIMEVMAFSSVFNLSWMLASIMMSTKLLILFSFLYWSTVILTLFMIYLTKMKNVSSESNNKTKKWIYFLIIINLAGIPPLVGFLTKWMVFMEMLSNNVNTLVILLLMSSSINLYIYMRMTNFLLMKNSDKTQKNNKETNKLITTLVITTNLFPLALLST